MKETGDFYHTEESVKQYFELAEGIDGRELIETLKKFLPKGKSILEIGMGPGKDMDILKSDYVVTGSDFSLVFLETYAKNNPEIELLELDARDLKTSKKFDALYSNKVLHHLSKPDLKRSIERQVEILNSKGLVCHSFWKGSGSEEYSGMLFQNYQEEEIENLFSTGFDILHLEPYSEMGSSDSILLIATKKT